MQHLANPCGVGLPRQNALKITINSQVRHFDQTKLVQNKTLFEPIYYYRPAYVKEIDEFEIVLFKS